MSKAKTVVADAVGAVVNGDAEQSAPSWSEFQVSLLQGGLSCCAMLPVIRLRVLSRSKTRL